MKENLYGIMIKYPEPGKVKTRLAQAVGREKAAAIYKCLVEKIMHETGPSIFNHPPLAKGGWGDLSEESQNNQISPNPSFPKRGIPAIPHGAGYREMMFDRIVFYDPPESLRDFDAWFPDEHLVQQRGTDVGERMDNVIRDLLGMGAQKAVITGADIPELTSAIIMEAFAALDHADIVIGPAKDGGYYLIGMKSAHPEIFQNIPWSTNRVFEETMKVIEKLKLRCKKITTLSDLDTANDYKRIFR